MKTYEIEDYSGNAPISLLADGKIIKAETGRKALDTYLKQTGQKVKVKVSASNTVHYKVTPVFIDENGKLWIDQRRGTGGRALWYQIQNSVA